MKKPWFFELVYTLNSTIPLFGEVFGKNQLRRWIKAIFNPAGLLILLITVLPWYIVQYLKEGQAFIDGFFLKHNVGRFNAPMEGHTGAIFYYIPVVLLAVMPYTGIRHDVCVPPDNRLRADTRSGSDNRPQIDMRRRRHMS